MNRPFVRGILAGILAPLLVLAGIVGWVYRQTGKVPFPVRREGEDEVVIGLVEPQDVPSYWEQWKAELQPLLDVVATLGRDLRDIKARYISD